MKSESDEQAIARILCGDPDGAATLVAWYGPALRRVLLHAGARQRSAIRAAAAVLVVAVRDREQLLRFKVARWWRRGTAVHARS